MPNRITVMPVFDILVAWDNRLECDGCEFDHGDLCILFDEELETNPTSKRAIRVRACLVAEMQSDNYHTCVPLQLQKSTPS